MIEVITFIIPVCIIGFLSYLSLFEDNTGCGCWVFLIWIAFQLWALYLMGVDVHFYMKHGYWLKHGSILQWLESDGEPVFVEWVGIRKILSNLEYKPWVLVSFLGHIVYGIVSKCMKEVEEDVDKQNN